MLQKTTIQEVLHVDSSESWCIKPTQQLVLHVNSTESLDYKGILCHLDREVVCQAYNTKSMVCQQKGRNHTRQSLQCKLYVQCSVDWILFYAVSAIFQPMFRLHYKWSCELTDLLICHGVLIVQWPVCAFWKWRHNICACMLKSHLLDV